MKSLEIITLKKPGIVDFAAERNKLLQRSKADWIFFVDSDEIVPPELEKEVRNTIQNTGLDAFYVYRKNYFLGQCVGKDKILRLAKKNSGRWHRQVHEVWDVGLHPRGVLENYLIHNTAQSLYDYINKINNYSKLHANANKKEGKRSNLLKIIFYPKLKFIQSMIMRRGVVFSIMQAFHSFLAWSELWLSQRN